jgi:hypothetical protein
VNDDNSKTQVLEVVLVFDASIGCDEYIESSLQQGQQAVIRKGAPIEIESCCDLVAWKEFGDSRVDAGV